MREKSKSYWRGLLHRYGIQREHYEALYQVQDGKCAICQIPEDGTKGLGVDHDHKTGRIRGLLCQECNIALGNFDDNVERVRKAAEYLELYSN